MSAKPTSVEILGSEARTASPSTDDQTNHGHRGLHVVIRVTDYPALASVVPKVEGKDPVSGAYYDILVGAAIAAVGTTVLKVYPGIAEVANLSASDLLPLRWRVSLAHADSDEITYSVGASLAE